MIKRAVHVPMASAVLAAVAAAGFSAFYLVSSASAEAPLRRPPVAGDQQPQTSPDERANTGAGEQKPDAEANAPPKDPTARALGGHIPPTARERAKLLADLYALLATAEDAAGAKKVQQAIEKVWQSSGSATVSVILQRAVKAVGDKREDLAEQLFDAAVDLAPDLPEAWNRRAFYYYKQNDFTRALGDLRRTLALEPNHFRALEGVATILRETGDERGAFKAYERLMEVNPLGEGVQKGYDELRVKVQGRGI